MLKRLVLNNFRNYPQVDFIPSPSISLISGANGSGKTSLLEAVYTLSTGKSFRTHKLSRLVKDGDDACLLFAEMEQKRVLHRLGMQRSKTNGIESLRIDGVRPDGLSRLARLLPVQVFHPNSVNLVYGEAALRRSYLDWGLFHVEQSFLADWRRFKNVLQQRNQLLKRSYQDASLMSVWDQQLVELSARIDRLRRSYLKQVEYFLLGCLRRISELPEIQLEYYAGWPQTKLLEEALATNFEKDAQRGFTSVGPQRADLRLKFKGQLAKDFLSRGECKLLGYALLLAQLQVMQATDIEDARCMLLIDDIASELDVDNRNAIMQELTALNQQIVMTAVDDKFVPDLKCHVAMFHVEHGRLERI